MKGREIIDLCEIAYRQILPSLKDILQDEDFGTKILFDLHKQADLASNIVRAKPEDLPVILKANDSKGTYTHDLNVANDSMAVARKLGCEKDVAQMVYDAALIHDLGKLFNGKYGEAHEMTDCEKAEHVIIGEILACARILNKSPLKPYMSNAIACHHDRLSANEGDSYPHKTTVLGKPAAIIQPADTWDAMYRRGGYQPTRSKGEIAKTLIDGAKSGLYMADAVDALLKVKGV